MTLLATMELAAELELINTLESLARARFSTHVAAVFQFRVEPLAARVLTLTEKAPTTFGSSVPLERRMPVAVARFPVPEKSAMENVTPPNFDWTPPVSAATPEV